MKVALYARYSSDNQREASITDQIRICRAFAEREGWTIADTGAQERIREVILQAYAEYEEAQPTEAAS